VDAPVSVGDVNIGPEEVVTRTEGPDYVSSWRTVAVGGLRRGGRGYYALDITQPDSITEQRICTPDGVAQPTSVAVTGGAGYVPACLGDLDTGVAPGGACGPRAFPAVLWELEDTWDEDLDDNPDLGDTWSVPVLGRIRVCDGLVCDPADPDNDIEDRWVAVFGGGFDEDAPLAGPGSGNFLYMVDVAAGAILYKEAVDGMVPSDPAAIDIDQDGYLDRLYIGTTAGHLYKVNLRSVPQLRDVQVSPGAGLPMVTVRRISTADTHDPAWRPFELFDTEGRPIFHPPNAIFLAEQGRFAVAFGSSDRDDLWRNQARNGRFYAFVDTDLPRVSVDLPLTASRLDLIGVDDVNLGVATNLLAPSPLDATAGWYIDLQAQERLITEPFALSGVLFFTTYVPDAGSVGPGSGSPGGGRNGDEEVCARTGSSRLFVVFATNADALAETDGVLQRYRNVPEFVTDPFATLSSTDNAPDGPGDPGDPGDPPGGPDRADDLCRDLDELSRQLRDLFPDSCRFGTYTLDIQTIRSDRGLVCIAPVPVCFQQQNWTEF
jgi:Tfp pilus tip-associated adhesin PilY1